MSFFSRLFGSRTQLSPREDSGKISVLRTLESMDARFEPNRCATCGATFVSGSMNPNLYVLDLKDYSLDVGGYCPACKEYCCPAHARFIRVPDDLAPAGDTGANPMGPWGIGCRKCGSRLVLNAEVARPAFDAPSIEVMLEGSRKMLGVVKLRQLKAMEDRAASRLLTKAPSVRKYLEVIRQEATIDFAQVEKERLGLVEELAGRLSDDDLTELVERSKDLKAEKLTMGAYNTYLMKLCRRNKIDMAKYSGLVAYTEYTTGAETIDEQAMWTELEQVTIPS